MPDGPIDTKGKSSRSLMSFRSRPIADLSLDSISARSSMEYFILYYPLAIPKTKPGQELKGGDHNFTAGLFLAVFFMRSPIN